MNELFSCHEQIFRRTVKKGKIRQKVRGPSPEIFPFFCLNFLWKELQILSYQDRFSQSYCLKISFLLFCWTFQGMLSAASFCRHSKSRMNQKRHCPLNSIFTLITSQNQLITLLWRKVGPLAFKHSQQIFCGLPAICRSLAQGPWFLSRRLTTF